MVISEISLVEVFKTNVHNKQEARVLIEKIYQRFELKHVNFDLEDCDRILRIEGDVIDPEDVLRFLNLQGVSAEILL